MFRTILVILFVLGFLSLGMRNSLGYSVISCLTWLTISLPFLQFTGKQKKLSPGCRCNGGFILPFPLILDLAVSGRKIIFAPGVETTFRNSFYLICFIKTI